MRKSNVLEGGVKIALAKIDSLESGLTIFQDGSELVFGLFQKGVGCTVTMSPDEALVLSHTLAEMSVLMQANISAVRDAIDDHTGRVLN